MARYYRVRQAAFNYHNTHAANFGVMDYVKGIPGAVASIPGRIGMAVGGGFAKGGNALIQGSVNRAGLNPMGRLDSALHGVGANLFNTGMYIGHGGDGLVRRAVGTGVLAGTAGLGYAGYRALNPRQPQMPMEEEMMEDPSMLEQYKQRAMNAYGSIRSRLSPQQPM